ncbi:DegV family protein [Pseudoxanthomonas suwonensis]|jgi:EDD domain protein, DegV family
MTATEAGFAAPTAVAAASEPATGPHRARTGIVIDASVDVPQDFLADPDVAVIPIPIRISGRTYVDKHDPEASARYMRENGNGEGVEGQSIPLDAPQMRDFFIERFALDYDSVYCLTITSTRSPIYEACSEGSALALTHIRGLRQAAEMRRPFQFRVIDTRNMFAGSGIPALALRDMLAAQMSPKDVRAELLRIVDSTYTYYIPDDLGYARTRSRVRGDRSIHLTSVVLGSALDIKPIIRGYDGDTQPVSKYRGRKQSWGRLFRFAAERVAEGRLHTPHVIVSYAGAMEELHATPELAELREACMRAGVSLHVLQMSITGMMNIGPGGLTLAYSGPVESGVP